MLFFPLFRINLREKKNLNINERSDVMHTTRNRTKKTK